MKGITVLTMSMVYNLIILGFTSYIVFGLGHSGWWFLLAVMLMTVPSSAMKAINK